MLLSRAVQGLLLGAAGLLLASLARGQVPGSQAEPPSPVSVEILVGYVSAQPGAIDPRLAQLSSMLGQDFKFQTMRVVQIRHLTLPLRQMGQVDMPSGHWVSVEPEEITSRGVRMGVEVQGMLRTHLHIPSGNQVVIGAYSYEQGRLVVRLVPTYVAPGASPEGPLPAR